MLEINNMITAKLRHLRISPRKVRLAADLIRNLDVTEAENQLKFLPKRAADPVLKLLKSAIANALNDFKGIKENLFVAKITVDPGPTLKRWMPRAMGRATPKLKRTSHITIGLEFKDGQSSVKEKIDKKSKIKEPKKNIDLLDKVDQPTKEEKSDTVKSKKIVPEKPYETTTKSKKEFSSNQNLGNAKKIFRRKSI